MQAIKVICFGNERPALKSILALNTEISHSHNPHEPMNFTLLFVCTYYLKTYFASY